MPSAAALAATSAGASHSSVEHTSSEIGAVTPIATSVRTKPTQSNSPSPGGTAVGETVDLVVLDRRGQRPVVHLDREHAVGFETGDHSQVVGAAGVVPDVNAVAAVRTSRGADDRLGIGGGGDVGVRQRFDADQHTVLGGAVAQRTESVRSLLE